MTASEFSIATVTALLPAVYGLELDRDVFVRPTGSYSGIDVTCSVGGSVIDDDDLPFHSDIDGKDPREDLFDRIRLVEDWNNDGKSH